MPGPYTVDGALHVAPHDAACLLGAIIAAADKDLKA
jgi:hypothetical protein